MKAVIFARVSSREQEESGYSLDSQVKLLDEFAKKNNFEVVRKFSISESASGKNKRELFNKMISYVNQNRVEVIICEKVDRFTRNFKDAVLIDEWLEKNENRKLVFVKESFSLTKDSKSADKLNWGIRILFAKNYIDNLKEEVKKGQKEKIAQGWLPTGPKLGYKTLGDDGHKIHVVDEERKHLIVKMFELYSSGSYSLKRLTETMIEAGLRNNSGKSLVKSRIHQVLTDPFYVGYIRWNGEIYLGRHKTFIDTGTFERVQKILKSKSTPRYSKHNHLFKGLIRCQECQGTITWEIHKGINYGHCNHYRNCTQSKWVHQSEVEEVLIRGLSTLQLKSIRLVKWIKKSLKDSHNDEIEVHSASVDELTKRQNIIKQRLDKIYDDKLDEKISEDFYQRKFSEYSEELRNIKKSLANVNIESLNFFKLSMNYYDLSQRSTEIYRKASIENKRSLIKLVFNSLFLKDGLLEWKYTKPFQILYVAVNATNGSKILNSAIKSDPKLELEEKIDEPVIRSNSFNYRPEVLGD